MKKIIESIEFCPAHRQIWMSLPNEWAKKVFDNTLKYEGRCPLTDAPYYRSYGHPKVIVQLDGGNPFETPILFGSNNPSLQGQSNVFMGASICVDAPDIGRRYSVTVFEK